MVDNFQVNSIMRHIVTFLDTPVKAILIIMLFVSLVMAGGLVAEMFQRKYHL